MADVIKLKGGSGDVPTLADKEPAYSRSEKALYVGTPNGNEKVGDANWETRIAALEGEVLALRNTLNEMNNRLEALEQPSE